MDLKKVALLQFILSLSGLIIFTSCQKELDRSDLNQVSVALVKALNGGDTAMLRVIFDRSLDRQSLIPIEQKGGAYGVQELSYSLINQLKGKQMKLQSVTKLDGNLVELITSQRDGFYSIRFFYRVREASGEDGAENVKKVKILFDSFADLNLVCKNYQDMPWKPDYIFYSFDKIEWSINTYNNRIIKDFILHLTNSHPTIDYNYLKFRLTLTSSDGEVFFNKTIESNEKIYRGDLSTVSIPDLDQFYGPVPMLSKNFTWKAELIEAGPKPPFDFCLKLEELLGKR